MIPKKLHFVWVGDESKRPDNCIQSWAKLNPEYEIVIWGNTALAEYSWVNKKHMDAMYSRELNWVADLMRYEFCSMKVALRWMRIHCVCGHWKIGCWNQPPLPLGNMNTFVRD